MRLEISANGGTSRAWIGRVSTVKVASLSQRVNRFSAAAIQVPAGIFAETEKLILKLIWECQGLRIAKTILEKKPGGLTLPGFTTYSQGAALEATAWWWHRLGQWDQVRVQNERLWQIGFQQKCPCHALRKGLSFQQTVLGHLCAYMQKFKVRS